MHKPRPTGLGTKNLYPILLVLVIILSFAVYLYTVTKPIPPGTDSAVYISGANWMVDNHSLPSAYQKTQNGISAYTARFTDINLGIFKLFTGLNISYPLFSIYQMLLVFLLIISSYLVGGIYSKRIAILFPLLLVGSFSLIRLFIGSTVSNILAFVYINFIFYLTHQYAQRGKLRYLALIGLLWVDIFLTHNYLTAPIFSLTVVIYLVFLYKVDGNFGETLKQKIVTIDKKYLFIIITLLALTFWFLASIYSPILKEAINSFWQTESLSKFRGVVYVDQYGQYLGDVLSSFSIIGLAFYVVAYRKNIFSYKVLPFCWLVVLFTLLHTYLIGVNFYFERLLFLAGVFVALFAAYFIDKYFHVFRHHTLYITVTLSLILILIVTTGTNKTVALYNSSNRVTTSIMRAYMKLNEVSASSDTVYSNYNVASDTRHDVIISDRKITKFSANERNCLNSEPCHYFNNPGLPDSLHYVYNNNVNFVILIMPGRDSTADVQQIIEKYRLSAHYVMKYSSADAYLFKLIR